MHEQAKASDENGREEVAVGDDDVEHSNANRAEVVEREHGEQIHVNVRGFERHAM